MAGVIWYLMKRLGPSTAKYLDDRSQVRKYMHTDTLTHTHTHSLSLTHTHTHTHTRKPAFPLLPQAILDKFNEDKQAVVSNLEKRIADQESVETILSCRKDVFEIMRVCVCACM